MWNDFQTDAYSGMIAETISFTGHAGKQIHAYYSRPIGEGRYPGIVLIPHMPGWDEWMRETGRRFTEHGYAVLCPDIYQDYGFGTPTEVSDRMRAAGIVPDSVVMDDTKGCLDFLKGQPQSNGKTINWCQVDVGEEQPRGGMPGERDVLLPDADGGRTCRAPGGEAAAAREAHAEALRRLLRDGHGGGGREEVREAEGGEAAAEDGRDGRDREGFSRTPCGVSSICRHCHRLRPEARRHQRAAAGRVAADADDGR